MLKHPSILSLPPPLLLQLLEYEKHFPDFPANYAELLDRPPNYVLPHKGQYLVPLCVVLAILATVAVLLRYYTRIWYQQTRLWWDDHFMGISMVIMWCWTAIQIMAVYVGGVGYHIYDNEWSTLMNALKIEIADQLVYILTALFIKTALFLFIYRISPPRDRWMRRIIRVSIGVLVVNFLLQLIMTMFACSPRRAVWDLSFRIKSKCIDWEHTMIGFSIAWSLTDLWAVLLPLPLVWQLQASWEKKVATILLFGLGMFATISSLVKIFFLHGVYNTWDPVWNALPVLTWHQVEVCVGIIAACLPTLSVLRCACCMKKQRKRRSFSAPSPFRPRRRGSTSTDEENGKGGSVTKEYYLSKQFPLDSSQDSDPRTATIDERDLFQPVNYHRANIQTQIESLKPPPQQDADLMLYYPRPANADEDEFQPVPAMWKTDETPKLAAEEKGIQLPELDTTGKNAGRSSSLLSHGSRKKPWRLRRTRSQEEGLSQVESPGVARPTSSSTLEENEIEIGGADDPYFAHLRSGSFTESVNKNRTSVLARGTNILSRALSNRVSADIDEAARAEVMASPTIVRNTVISTTTSPNPMATYTAIQPDWIPDSVPRWTETGADAATLVGSSRSGHHQSRRQQRSRRGLLDRQLAAPLNGFGSIQEHVREREIDRLSTHLSVRDDSSVDLPIQGSVV